MFRLTINDEEHNDNAGKLGDRDLAAWVGSSGNLHFATYSYVDLHGNGNPNAHHDIAYDDFINHWHWVYFGYSREERKAFVRVMINESTDETFTF